MDRGKAVADRIDTHRAAAEADVGMVDVVQENSFRFQHGAACFVVLIVLED